MLHCGRLNKNFDHEKKFIFESSSTGLHGSALFKTQQSVVLCDSCGLFTALAKSRCARFIACSYHFLAGSLPNPHFIFHINLNLLYLISATHWVAKSLAVNSEISWSPNSTDLYFWYQHRNTNMNDKDHLVGQLTIVKCVKSHQNQQRVQGFQNVSIKG